jgi:hypothetical protein
MFTVGRNFFMRAEWRHDSNPLKKEERGGPDPSATWAQWVRRNTADLSAIMQKKFSHPFAGLANRMRMCS